MQKSFRVAGVVPALLMFIMLLLHPEYALGAVQPLEMQTEDERLVRWDLTADNLTSLNDSEILEASGNVLLRRGSEYMKADFARYYMSTKWVFLQGNVVIMTGKDEITAEEAEFDLRSRTGWLRKGRIFMAGPHAYIAGDHINKHWGDVYTFKQAKITTCDGDVPAWSFTAEEAVVELDGYARLTRSSFQVKDVPVGYTPYFVFPVKTKRQTGFLFPEYGSSSQKGMFYSQPFFWAIDDSNDMTFSETWMEKRGFMHGVEARTKPAEDTAGWLRFDWLHDAKNVPKGHSNPYSELNTHVRTNYDRYWIRGMYDTVLPDPAWRFKADLDYVSDQDFLREFKGMYGGFHYSRNALFKNFSRDLRERDQDRVSGILLTREWNRGSIALSSTYTQNPYFGNGNTSHREDPTVQQVPQFDAFLYKGRIVPSLPFEIEGSAQAAYMYRRSGTRGARYQASPRVTLPLSSRYGYLTTSAGLVQTYYETEKPSHSNAVNRSRPNEDGDTRTVPDFTIASGTEFSRIFSLDKTSLPASKESVGKSQWVGLKHSVQPRVEYNNRPYKDQDDNPYYIHDDRLEPRSELVYSLTNLLTVKGQRVSMRQSEDTGQLEPVLEDYYHNLVRLRVQQAYDIREANRNEKRDQFTRRPYGDIFADLTFYPTQIVSLSTRNDWSPYLDKITRHQSGVNFFFPEYGSIYAGYDFRSKIHEYKRERDFDIKYLTLRTDLSFLDPVYLSFSYSRDAAHTKNTEKGMYITYNHQCFQVIGSALVEPQEKSYHLSIVLTGLGER